MDATTSALGEAVGRLYVRSYFPPAAKAAAREMVTNLMAAFGRRIDALDWMAPATKAGAKAKLAVLKVGVGYPDTLARLLGPARSGAATRSATSSARSGSSTSATWRSSASPSTAPSGS